MKKKVLDIIIPQSTTKHIFDFKKYALIKFFFRFIEIKNQLKGFLPQFHAIGNIKVCRYVCLFENIMKSILTYFLILIKINMYYKKMNMFPIGKTQQTHNYPTELPKRFEMHALACFSFLIMRIFLFLGFKNLNFVVACYHLIRCFIIRLFVTTRIVVFVIFCICSNYYNINFT